MAPSAPDRAGRCTTTSIEALERIVAADARQRAATARALGLVGSDVLALRQIRRARELAPGALARRMPLSPAGTAAATDRLLRAGLIVRRRDPRDGRRAVLAPSRSGSTRLDQALQPLRADLDALVATLAPSERACVERFLARLAELSERHAERLTDAARAAARLPVPWG